MSRYPHVLYYYCSIDDFSKSSCPYYFGTTRIKSLEFVDDIADLNDDMISAQVSYKFMENMQDQKRLTFSADKCQLLRINPKPYSVGASLTVNNAQVKKVEFACYLGDYFNFYFNSGDNTTLCKECCLRTKGSAVELIALCKEIKFGKRKIENMLVLYKAVFLPRLIYNCEAWSNLDKDDYMMLQNSQLNYLSNVMEVSRAVPIAALCLNLGVLPIRYGTKMRQLFFLKGILNKDPCDPVKLSYEKMKKFGSEKSWTNNMFGLQKEYNLSLNDANVQNMSHKDWTHLVNSTLVRHAFLKLKKGISN